MKIAFELPGTRRCGDTIETIQEDVVNFCGPIFERTILREAPPPVETVDQTELALDSGRHCISDDETFGDATCDRIDGDCSRQSTGFLGLGVNTATLDAIFASVPAGSRSTNNIRYRDAS